MAYQIDITPVAEQEIRGLPSHIRNRVRRLIGSLANVPRPPRSKTLREQTGLHRLPIEDWRIIYEVDDDEQVVLIVTVRRKTGPETYQNMPPYRERG